jgi:hypothetical protein
VGIEVSEFSDFDVFMPDNANHVVYMRLYKLFKELRGSMKRYWKERAHFIRVTTPRGNENDVFQ